MSDILKLILFSLFFCKSIAVNSRYYPRYHLAPPNGWLSDPNGFCVFKGDYHMFYQYNPESSQGAGITHWGHAKSKDLFHWEHLPIALYPEESYDKTGVFSGSALVQDDTMFLFYTANLNTTDENGKIERQAIAKSTDGVNFLKYAGNPIVDAPNRQPNIRDPKVWQYQDRYYMLLGNSFDNDTRGRVLLYSSEDMFNWKEISIIGESDGTFGYMWECPDLFELNGKFVFVFCPQGVKAQGDKYKNVYQCGYIVGSMDYETGEFTTESEFKELDHGHDFYAIHTTRDSFGRRLLVAWFSSWGEVYPERDDGWAGLLTIPRELTLSHENTIIQTPVFEAILQIKRVQYEAEAFEGDIFEIEDNSGLLMIHTLPKDLNISLESESDNSTVFISYDHEKGLITLDRGGDDGVRRTNWRPHHSLHWKIYVDASSIELFCGAGEVTFSSRYFPEGQVFLRIGEGSYVDNLAVVALARTVVVPEDE